jgi:hypothetical protein
MSLARLVRRPACPATLTLVLALAGMSLAACAAPAPDSAAGQAGAGTAAAGTAPGGTAGTDAPADAGQAVAGTGEEPGTAPAAQPAAEPQAQGSASSGSAAAETAATGKAAASGYRRVELPGGAGQPFPYTVEIPEGWKIHEVPNTASLWLGPATAKPGDPSMITVRISPASLADPAAVAANIRASDAADPKWSAPLVEVRDVNGVQGILVRMDSGEGDAARSTLALKLPLPKTSVDFLASAPQSQFESLRPSYERILFSVAPRK